MPMLAGQLLKKKKQEKSTKLQLLGKMDHIVGHKGTRGGLKKMAFDYQSGRSFLEGFLILL